MPAEVQSFRSAAPAAPALAPRPRRYCHLRDNAAVAWAAALSTASVGRFLSSAVSSAAVTSAALLTFGALPVVIADTSTPSSPSLRWPAGKRNRTHRIKPINQLVISRAKMRDGPFIVCIGRRGTGSAANDRCGQPGAEHQLTSGPCGAAAVPAHRGPPTAQRTRQHRRRWPLHGGTEPTAHRGCGAAPPPRSGRSPSQSPRQGGRTTLPAPEAPLHRRHTPGAQSAWAAGAWASARTWTRRCVAGGVPRFLPRPTTGAWNGDSRSSPSPALSSASPSFPRSFSYSVGVLPPFRFEHEAIGQGTANVPMLVCDCCGGRSWKPVCGVRTVVTVVPSSG